MTDQPTCATCKHWESLCTTLGYGRCRLSLHWMDYEETCRQHEPGTDPSGRAEPQEGTAETGGNP